MFVCESLFYLLEKISMFAQEKLLNPSVWKD